MESKVVVITGASAGIGAATAVRLGAEGYALVLDARRKRELDAVAARTAAPSLAVVADVTRRADVENLRDAALARFGHVDVWINNAGRGIGKKILDVTDADFDEIIASNLKSVFYGIQTIIPHFQERGQGHLINISSFLSRVPLVTFRSVYSAAKSAVNVLTAVLRLDLLAAYPGIKVSLVLPGIVRTGFPANALGGTPAVPGGRRSMSPQEPEEVAETISDLILHPRPEVYTSLALSGMFKTYCEDTAVFEENMVRGTGT
jgi:NADP-dependent 3-hydroxy acid dehydrogenase YdfG